ncbi:hypothetical protein TNCV_4227811 [Trichonephila clavipes]|nr:hypothetical protein TNCV_4227811 [Trichonephila clavipes]
MYCQFGLGRTISNRYNRAWNSCTLTYHRCYSNNKFLTEIVPAGIFVHVRSEQQHTACYDEEESNDEEYNSKYHSSTESEPDLEEGDIVENKCFMCRDTKTFEKNVTLKETTGTPLIHF